MPNSVESAPVSSYMDRLRTAGALDTDSAEDKLNKSLLMLATGLLCLTTMIWTGLYSYIGPQFSSTLPLLAQALLVGNVLLYIKTQDFKTFRATQLGLMLFLPFVAQWLAGNFISSSGIVLWGLLAPIGALLCFGVRESLGWFIAWVILTALTGVADFYLADALVVAKPVVSIRTSVAFFTLNFIAVSAIIYLLLRHSIIAKNETQKSLADAHEMLQDEQDRSEKLLLNILPGSIAERLKNSNQTIADGFADVSVMFADIVNFTQVAADMAPSQVFSMLNRIFSAFDELAEEHKLEKIKTIGDAYMIAGGLNANEEEYSIKIADMALAMRDLLKKDFAINASHLDIRIGIGTGPVIAGVVGKKKFIYDLWGDTVNIASRITSEGVPGMIQCDTTTYYRLRATFEFHEPQVIYLKGKGDMIVYRLIGRKQPFSNSDAY